MEEKKNGEKEGKEKEESILRRKTYFLLRKNTEKEKEENIWRRKISFFCGGEEKKRGKRRKIFKERKYLLVMKKTK